MVKMNDGCLYEWNDINMFNRWITNCIMNKMQSIKK